MVTALSVPGAVAVNLPAGVTGQIFCIVDGTGDASSNNVTIDGNGAEQINGSNTYVINKDRAGVVIGFNGTSWTVLAEFTNIAAGTIPRSSIAAGSANHVVINDGSGLLSSEATLAKSRGGSGQDNSSLTFPATGTIPTNAGSATFSNKTLDNTCSATFLDSGFTLQDNGDNTKQFVLQLSGISAGQTRTMTVPDASFTAVGTATTQQLTNKDYDGGTASDSLRLTVPKNTTSNLNGLSRKQATLLYDSTLDVLKIDNGVSLSTLATNSLASPTAAGIVTSFFPTCKSSTNSVSSADYTILDTDGYETIFMSTAGSNRTVTLPTAADNIGRTVKIVKTDSGVGKVIVDGEGAETINGKTTIDLYAQYDYVLLECNGTGWLRVAGEWNWCAYTPTFTAFGTESNVSFYFRRVGASMDIRGSFTAGTTTGSEARITFADSLTSSSTYVSAVNTPVGVYFIDKGTADKKGGGILIQPSLGYFNFNNFGTFGTAAVGGLSKANGDAVVEPNDPCRLFITGVLITEWA